MQLDEYQKLAAAAQEPDVCTVACPGSGKSTTLAATISAGMDKPAAGAPVVISFTNAAADAIARKVEYPVAYVGTLHGFCFKMLRRQTPTLTLIDEDEAARMLTLTAERLRYKGTAVALEQARADFWRKGMTLGTHTDAQRVVLAYAADLVRENLIEYDLLLARAAKFLREGKGAEMPRVQWFVDEFQDTANVDMDIYSRYPHSRMVAVGDPDQCIFTFRGANPGNMLEYYERSARYVLLNNYRSTPAIVDAANALIAHNKQRVPITMRAVRQVNGPRPQAFLETDPTAHDFRIAEIIGLHLSAGIDPAEIAVLCRTNKEVQEMQAFLASRGFPASTRAETIPDMGRVRTLIGLCLNPRSTVLDRIERNQRHADRSLEGPWRAAPARTVEELMAVVREYHSFSDTMKKIIAQAVDSCPPNEPARLLEFLRQRETRTRGEGIQVGTMHWAKGQEFEVVIIAGADSGLDEKPTEEDRRLWYVALTRAKYAAYAVGAAHRFIEFKGFLPRAVIPFAREAEFQIHEKANPVC